MRLVIDVQVDDETLQEARDQGRYQQLLEDLAGELHETIEHEWDTPDGWFRITYIASHAAPKDLLRVPRK